MLTPEIGRLSPQFHRQKYMAKPAIRTLAAMAAETRFGGLPQIILRTLTRAGGRANG